MSEPTSTSQEEATPLRTHREGGDGVWPDAGRKEVWQTVMFTDIANSVSLTGVLGREKYAEVLARHGQLFREALREIHPESKENTGDGFVVRFADAAEAVGVALRFQWLLRREKWDMAQTLRVRVGIGGGNLLLMAGTGETKETPHAVGVAMSLAARVMGMGDGGQVLLTREIFEKAREAITAVPGVSAEEQAALEWREHGAYLVKGVEGPQEVFEVGERGHAPFRHPRDGVNAERVKSTGDPGAEGWHPAPGAEVPGRPDWRLVRKLGQGGFGEVWLAENRAGEKRVFKFCFDVVKLRSFRHELELFHFIRQTLGPRPDIATLYDAQLETSPYFIEGVYYSGGTLAEWLERKFREGEVPLGRRLAIVAEIARALAAAHSVEVIHKDVKPSNVLIEEFADGTVQPRLADFGIGELANPDPSPQDQTLAADSMRYGAPMYCAPEFLMTFKATPSTDIYALGVVLYQVASGNFQKPLGSGWKRNVPDALLAEDIEACVDEDPTRRLGSAMLVAERLETFQSRRAARRLRRWARIGVVIALGMIAALTGTAAFLQHSKTAETQRSQDLEEQRYRQGMIATMANIDKWRGESGRNTVMRYKDPATCKPNQCGWELTFARDVLNPPHLKKVVSSLPLRALAVSPDETKVAVGGDDGNVSIWSCETLEKIESWRTTPVRSLAWKGDVLAIGLANGNVVLREVTAKLEREPWKAHAGAVSTLAWDPVNDELTTGGEDGVIAWWRGDGSGPTGRKPDHREGTVLALDWKEDGSKLAVILGEPTRLLAGPPDEFDHEFPIFTSESAIAWRPIIGRDEVAISYSGLPMSSYNLLWTTDDFHLTARYSPGASAYAWAPDGKRVAVGGVDGKIIVPEQATPPEASPVFYGHTQRVTAMRWLHRERLLSVSEDGTLRAWDDLRHPPHVQMTVFNVTLSAAQWHPLDDRAAVMLGGDEVRVLDATRQTVWMRPMPAPAEKSPVFAGGRLAWSPNGKWLAAACPGRGLVAWSMESDERFLEDGLKYVTDVQWLGDNRALLVHTPDGWWRISREDGTRRQLADKETLWMGELEEGNYARVVRNRNTINAVVAKENAAPSISVPLPKEFEKIRVCAFNSDRTQLAIGAETGALAWVDTHRGSNAWRPTIEHSSAIQAIGWHPDGSRLVTASSDGTCNIYNVFERAPTWTVEHQLLPEIRAAGWDHSGKRLMLASAQSRALRFYDASPEIGTREERARSILAAIEDHPDEESAWKDFDLELQGDRDESTPVLTAVAKLGVQARLTSEDKPPSADLRPAQTWRGMTLPRVVQVAQACAFKNWDEVVHLTADSGAATSASWLGFARAAALAEIGRKKEAEGANFTALKALRRLQGDKDFPAQLALGTGDGSSVDFTIWANARPNDDWAVDDPDGTANNRFPKNRKFEPQRDGVEFHFGNFILLGGQNFRLSGERMLPRSTPWVPFNKPSRKVACAVAACNTFDPQGLPGTCIGSIFLLRQDGGVVNVPLIYGKNIWGWWVPQKPVPEAQRAATIFNGSNERAESKQHDLALYRLDWSAEAGESPVVAIAIASTMRRPAPLLMSVDAQP